MIPRRLRTQRPRARFIVTFPGDLPAEDVYTFLRAFRRQIREKAVVIAGASVQVIP
jgi:hypothetical protein